MAATLNNRTEKGSMQKWPRKTELCRSESKGFSQWRTQKSFIGGCLVQGHMVVIWCTLFVTSQFDVISIAKFADIICMFFYIHSPYFMCHCTE